MKQEVYYDKKLNLFVHIKETIDNGYIVGGHASYYSDAITNTTRVPLSEEYCKENLLRVDCVDKFAFFNGIGWTTQPKGDTKNELIFNWLKK